jgi:hypothetical protein
VRAPRTLEDTYASPERRQVFEVFSTVVMQLFLLLLLCVEVLHRLCATLAGGNSEFGSPDGPDRPRVAHGHGAPDALRAALDPLCVPILAASLLANAALEVRARRSARRRASRRRPSPRGRRGGAGRSTSCGDASAPPAARSPRAARRARRGPGRLAGLVDAARSAALRSAAAALATAAACTLRHGGEGHPGMALDVLDDAAALFVVASTVGAAFPLARRTGRCLLQTRPTDLAWRARLDRAADQIDLVDGALSHSLRVWSHGLDAGSSVVTVEVSVRGGADADAVRRAVRRLLRPLCGELVVQVDSARAAVRGPDVVRVV